MSWMKKILFLVFIVLGCWSIFVNVKTIYLRNVVRFREQGFNIALNQMREKALKNGKIEISSEDGKSVIVLTLAPNK